MKSIFVKIYFLPFLIFLVGINSSCTKEKNDYKDSDSTRITRQDSIQIKKYEHFLFVGYYYGKPSVYKYQLEEKKFKVRWNDYRESVTILLFDPDKPASFFLTARSYGKKDNYPRSVKFGPSEMIRWQFINKPPDSVNIRVLKYHYRHNYSND